MAGTETLVGMAFLSSFLSVLFNKIAYGDVPEFFKARKLNNRILKKLEITMISVNGVLEDAEEKQITKPAVMKWVTQLKDAVYDADDLLDEIAYEALKQQAKVGSVISADQVKKLFSSINPFKKGLGFEARLEEILERLELLMKQKDALGLKEAIGEKQSSQRTPTTSLVDESGVIGRDADKEAVMKMMLQSESDDGSGKKLVVIPIVGMGGIGKTTLAQLVYNDSRVRQQFDLRAWVCVSEEKDPLMVTKHVFKEVTSLNYDGMTLNQVHAKLKGRLEGKRFLLVLDDVWNVDFWDDLQRPLNFGAQGSVILLTTRDESIAAVMGTVLARCLKELDYDDSWLLFAKHAFADENCNSRPDLEVVGRAIVEKCKGLPLAAKTLGGLLRSKKDVKEWKNILKSNLWDLPDDKIISPLWLSYHYLPSHLKQCFAYCTLFPKDYEFQKKELILLWMAEGFLTPTEGVEEMEEVGDQYFQDLVSRSFFTQVSQHYIMHDLIHDLAESVSKKFYLRLEDDHSCNITKHTRHLSSSKGWHISSKIFMEVNNAIILRTVLLGDSQYRNTGLNVKIVNDVMRTLKKLRVLSLSNCYNIDVLPNSICKMKHLRYLNFSRTIIKRLPESIQSLYNLQILILHGCYDLIELPTNMVKLINLFHLDIGGTRVKEMPLQMGKLTKLRELSDFIVGEQSGSRISEMRELKHLRGKLYIQKLENVKNPQEAFDANLKDKKHLKELVLLWSWDRDTDALHNRKVLEQLQPHTNVEHLKMAGYGGTSFAGWVGDSSFSSMVSLTIERCKHCYSLPPLGQLPYLKRLSIWKFDEVKIVGPEFHGSSKKPFPSLESLRFNMMPQWEEWIPFAEDEDDDEGGAFPVLQELFIENCRNLKKSLPNHLPCLTRLEIRGCHDQIVTSLPRAPQLLSLTALKWTSLDYQIGHMSLFLATLEDIAIQNCHSVKCIPLEKFPKLKRLRIWGSTNLERLVGVENVHGNFTSPESLQITELKLCHCSSLKSLPQRMQSLLPSLESLTISDCSEVQWFSEGGLPSKLKSLHIERCKKLVVGYKQWNLQLLSSLSYFRIGDIDDVESFPEKSLLPSTLTVLSIKDFKNLKSLDCEGLQHLTNLTSLEINGCSKFQCLSNQWNLQSLSSLSKFYIEDIDEVESFPQKMLLPSTLTELRIKNFKNLKSLDYEGLQHLTNLTCLEIYDCDKLKCLPEEGLPSSLNSLGILRCPLLGQRCQRKKGEDWPKIARIPSVKVNYKKIN